MIYELFLTPVFKILNFEIPILYSTNGDTFKIKLYFIVVLIFLCNLISFTWNKIMSSGNGGD